jgi:hypothetical protein
LAKGLYAFLLSAPEDFQCSKEDVLCLSQFEDKKEVEDAWNELEALGYIVRAEQYFVYVVPQNENP